MISNSSQIIIMFILVFVVINPWSKRLVYTYGKNINHMKLPDMFHNDNFNIKHLSPYNDIMVSGILLLTIYNLYCNKHNNNDAILFIKYLAIAKILKMILMTVTVLPDASGQCSIQDKLQNPMKFYFMSGCNDLIFSFHMATVLFCLYFLKKNNVISRQTAIMMAHRIIIH
jgi:hypothetical protein